VVASCRHLGNRVHKLARSRKDYEFVPVAQLPPATAGPGMPCRAFPAVVKPPPTSGSVWLCAGSETPVDEDGRSFKVDEVMAEFADSIEEIEDEHSNDLA